MLAAKNSTPLSLAAIMLFMAFPPAPPTPITFILALYVFFLGLGTVGELFEIEWILNLPLFK